MSVDFSGHRDPVQAVPCPVRSCSAGIGHWCKRPSGHKATTFHQERRDAADRAWLEAGAPFLDSSNGRVVIRAPRNKAEAAALRAEVVATEECFRSTPEGDATMAKKTAKKTSKKTPAKTATKTPKARRAPKSIGPSPFAGTTPKAAAALTVPHKDIRPSDLNPRKVVDGDALASLAESIISEGVLQALLVRPAGKNRYEIINGERRWRAVDAAINANRLPATYEMPVRVRDCSDAELVELAAAENMARQDMTPLEEADVIAAMRKYHGDDAEIARRLGLPERTLYRRVALLKLCPALRDALGEDKITQQQAAVFALGSHKAQKDHWDAIVEDMQDEGEGTTAADTWNGRLDTIREAMTESMVLASRVLFDLDLYKGEIVEENGERYLVDSAQAKKLQDAAIKARIAEVKKQWPWCKRIEAYDRHNYTKTKKDNPKAGAVYYVDHDQDLVVVAPVLSAEDSKKANKAKTREKTEERDERSERREATIGKLFDILIEQPGLVMAREIAGECVGGEWEPYGSEAEQARTQKLLQALHPIIGKAVGAKKVEQLGEALISGDEEQVEAKLVAALMEHPLEKLAGIYGLLRAENCARQMVDYNTGELEKEGLEIAQRYLPGFEPAGLQEAAE